MTGRGERPDGPARVGPYRVEGVLGEGGMGTVYRGVDPESGQAHALKVLGPGSRPDLRERFAREARAMASVDHPAVCRVHRVGTEPGVGPWMAMEILEGRSLRDVLDEGPLDPRETARIGARLAEGLSVAHAEGVLHRDVKPENVVLRPDGTPVLTDFGIARVADETRITETGAILGSPFYMAPEQAAGEVDRLGPPSDVWGLGATLHASLGGRHPFEGGAVMEILAAVLREEPRPLPADVPDGLEAIVGRALAKDPADRQATAGELAADLQAWLAGKETSATAARARGPGTGVAIAVAGLGLAVLLAFLAARALVGGPVEPEESPGPGTASREGTDRSAPDEAGPAPEEASPGPSREERLLAGAIEAIREAGESAETSRTLWSLVEAAPPEVAARALRWLGRLDAFGLAEEIPRAPWAPAAGVDELGVALERAPSGPLRTGLRRDLARGLAAWGRLLVERPAEMARATGHELVPDAEDAREERLAEVRERLREVTGPMDPAERRVARVPAASVDDLGEVPLVRTGDPQLLGFQVRRLREEDRLEEARERHRRRMPLVLEPPGEAGRFLAAGRRARLRALGAPSPAARTRALALLSRAAVLDPWNGTPQAVAVPLLEDRRRREAARHAFDYRVAVPDTGLELAEGDLLWTQSIPNVHDLRWLRLLDAGRPDILASTLTVAAGVEVDAHDRRAVVHAREWLERARAVGRAHGRVHGDREAASEIRAAAEPPFPDGVPDGRRIEVGRDLLDLERANLPRLEEIGVPTRLLRVLHEAARAEERPGLGLLALGTGLVRDETPLDLLGRVRRLVAGDGSVELARETLREEGGWAWGPPIPVARALLELAASRPGEELLPTVLRAVDAAPGSAGAFVLLGVARLRADDPEAARADLDAALEVLGEGPEGATEGWSTRGLEALARLGRAEAVLRLGDREAASEDRARWRDLVPEADPESWARLPGDPFEAARRR